MINQYLTARQNGYTDEEIASHFAGPEQFQTAINAGYNPGEIARHLSGVKEEDYQRHLLSEHERAYNLENTGDTVRGLKSGIDETQATLYGATGLMGKVLGSDTLKDWGMEGYRRNMEEASVNPTKQLSDIDGAGSFVDWAQGTAGKLFPSMMAAATGGGAGAVGAKFLTKKAISAYAKKEVASQIAKGAVKEAAQETAEAALKNQLSKQAIKYGSKAGLVGAVLPMEAGGNYAGLLESHGVDAPYTALGFGALATSLEFIPGGNAKLVDKFLDAAMRGDGNIAKRIGKEILKSAPSEAIQEAGQETLSVLNTVVNTDEKLLTAKNMKQIIEAGAAGAMGGGMGGAMAGVIPSAKPPEKIKEAIPGGDDGRDNPFSHNPEDALSSDPAVSQAADQANQEIILRAAQGDIPESRPTPGSGEMVSQAAQEITDAIGSSQTDFSQAITKLRSMSDNELVDASEKMNNPENQQDGDFQVYRKLVDIEERRRRTIDIRPVASQIPDRSVAPQMDFAPSRVSNRPVASQTPDRSVQPEMEFNRTPIIPQGERYKDNPEAVDYQRLNPDDEIQPLDTPAAPRQEPGTPPAPPVEPKPEITIPDEAAIKADLEKIRTEAAKAKGEPLPFDDVPDISSTGAKPGLSRDQVGTKFTEAEKAEAKAGIDDLESRLDGLSEAIKADMEAVKAEPGPKKIGPGAKVKWKTKGGKELAGTILQKRGKAWEIKKPDGKRTFQPAGNLSLVEGDQPKVKQTYYHGTMGKFDKLEASTAQAGHGVFLTTSPESASEYGNNVLEVDVNVEDVASDKDWKEAFDELEAEHERKIEAIEMDSSLSQEEYQKKLHAQEREWTIGETEDPRQNAKVSARLQRKGFDAFETGMQSGAKGKELLVFVEGNVKIKQPSNKKSEPKQAVKTQTAPAEPSASNDIIPKSGKPYKNMGSAKIGISRAKALDTHEPVQVDGGWVGRVKASEQKGKPSNNPGKPSEQDIVEDQEVFDVMQSQVNGSQTKGVNYDQDGNKVWYGASSPKWMENLQAAAKRSGQRVFSRTELNTLFDKVRGGLPLTKLQSERFELVKDAAEEVKSTDSSFAQSYEAEEMEEQGFTPMGGQDMAAAELDKGDSFIGTVEGKKDTWEVKGEHNGNIVLQDGIRKEVDIFDEVQVDGLKKNGNTIRESGQIDLFDGKKSTPHQGSLFDENPKPKNQKLSFRPVSDNSRDSRKRKSQATGGNRSKNRLIRKASVGVETTGDLSHSGLTAESKEDVASLLAPLGRSAQEKLYTVAVDKDGTILEVHAYSKGSVSSSISRPIEVAGRALNVPGTDRVYFVHNHPSGSFTPSSEDISALNKIRNILRLRKIKTDAIILSMDRWSEFSVDTLSGNGTQKDSKYPSKKTHKRTKSTKIPVKERVFNKRSPGSKHVTGPKDAEGLLVGRVTGFLFLNTKNQEVGFLPFRPGEKIKDITAEVISSAEQTGASSLIINNNEFDAEGRNEFFVKLSEAVSDSGLNVLDILTYMPGGYIDHKSNIQPNSYSMRKLNSGKPQYSTRATTPGQNVTLKDIQKRFKGQSVILNDDGSVSIRFKNGSGLRIKSVKQVSEGRYLYSTEVGKMDQNGVIAGKYQNSEIELVEGVADGKTMDHELEHHLEAIGVITAGDRLVLDGKIAALAKKGKFKKLKDQRENRANFLSEYLHQREQFRGTGVGRVLQKIADFLDAVLYLGRASVRGLAREVESGRIYERPAGGKSKNQEGQFSTVAEKGYLQDQSQAFAKVKDWAKAIAKPRKIKTDKPDISPIARVLSVLSHYAERTPTSAAIAETILNKSTYKTEKETDLFSDENGVDLFKKVLLGLQKKNKLLYKRLNEYILGVDLSGKGWTVKKKGDEWVAKTAKRHQVGTYETEVEAEKAAMESEAKDYNGTADEKNALYAYRKIALNTFHQLHDEWGQIIEDAQREGAPIPEVVIEKPDGAVRVDLATARKMMGDLRGSYFPRIRQSGKFELHAKSKDGSLLEYDDSKKRIDARANELERHGYTVTVGKADKLSEDVFASIRQTVNVNAAINRDLAKLPPHKRKLADMGIKGKWVGDDYVISGEINASMDEFIEVIGGKFEDRVRNLKHSKIYTPTYVFENAPKGIEKKAAQAIYRAKGVGFNVNRQFAASLVESMADEIKAHGAMSRMITRSTKTGKDVVKGYEEDMNTAVASLVSSIAGSHAKRKIAQRSYSMLMGQEESWEEFQARHPDGNTLAQAKKELDGMTLNSEGDIAKVKNALAEVGKLKFRLLEGKQTSVDIIEDLVKQIRELNEEIQGTLKYIDKGKAKALRKRIGALSFQMREDYSKQVESKRIDPAKQSNLYDGLTETLDDVLRNDDAVDRAVNRVRAATVFYFLAGRVSSAAVNLTNLGMAVPARMKADGIPFHKSTKNIGNAIKLYGQFKFGKTKLPSGQYELFKAISDKGLDIPQFNMEAFRAVQSASGRAWGDMMNALMKPFAVTESINRAGTVAGAYISLAEKSGKGMLDKNGNVHPDLLQQSKKISDDAHGIYERANRPDWMKGSSPAAKLITIPYIFQTFTQNYLLTMGKLGYRGIKDMDLKNPASWKNDNVQGALWMAFAPTIFGVGSALGTKIIINAIGKAIGSDDPEEDFFRYLEKNFGTPAERFARYGVTGMMEHGVDFSGSLSIGMPDAGMGAFGSMAGDMWEGIQNVGKGFYWEAAEDFAPSFIKNPLEAARKYKHGTTTYTGAPVFYEGKRVQHDEIDAFLEVLSFRPSREGIKLDKRYRDRKLKDKYKSIRSDIYHHYKGAKTRAERLKVKKMINEYNHRVRDKNLKARGVNYITNQSIKSAVRPREK